MPRKSINQAADQSDEIRQLEMAAAEMEEDHGVAVAAAVEASGQHIDQVVDGDAGPKLPEVTAQAPDLMPAQVAAQAGADVSTVQPPTADVDMAREDVSTPAAVTTDAEGAAGSHAGDATAPQLPAAGADEPSTLAAAAVSAAASPAAADGHTEGAAQRSAPARKPLTTAQAIQRAQRERERGLKHIGQRVEGVASAIIKVRIDNAQLARQFERFFAPMESCAYFLQRNGGLAVGDKARDKLIERFTTMCDELHAKRDEDMRAANELVARIQNNIDFVHPEFVAPAFDREVQTRTPMGRRVIHAFMKSDALFTQLHVLYWNGERTLSQVDEELYRIRRDLTPLIRFSNMTVLRLRNSLVKRVSAKSEAQAA